MISDIPVRLGGMAVAAATAAALVSAGSASARTAGPAHTLSPARAAGTTQPAGASASPGGRPRGHVPSPQVIGPITGGLHHHPFTSSPVPLGLAGYTEQEFFVKGIATGYRQAGTWGSDGRSSHRREPDRHPGRRARLPSRRPAGQPLVPALGGTGDLARRRDRAGPVGRRGAPRHPVLPAGHLPAAAQRRPGALRDGRGAGSAQPLGPHRHPGPARHADRYP